MAELEAKIADFERVLKERDERPSGAGSKRRIGDTSEQRESDCIDPSTGLPMLRTLPRDVAWPTELPIYGSIDNAGRNRDYNDDSMGLVWPKCVRLPSNETRPLMSIAGQLTCPHSMWSR